MKQQFTKKIAKEIAEKSFGYVLDCILGYSDDDYNLSMKAEEFEQNFTEDLEEKNIIVTGKRINVINDYYDQMTLKLVNSLRKKFYDKYKSNETS